MSRKKLKYICQKIMKQYQNNSYIKPFVIDRDLLKMYLLWLLNGIEVDSQSMLLDLCKPPRKSKNSRDLVTLECDNSI
jgi:hypothetical protein